MKKQKGHRMLDPQQFEVGEAWIAFRLNSAPIRTERDGDFNCVALMDAASCCILGSELVPAGAGEPSSMYSRRLLKSSQKHNEQLPRTLFVTEGDVADLFTREAIRQKVDVVPVSLLALAERPRRHPTTLHAKYSRANASNVS
jgi:hypothetical protein